MINELFIKISDYKTLQGSSDFTLQSIKQFLCVKIWKWMEKKQSEFLQLNFYFMPCWLRVVWKYSFPALLATVLTTYAHEKACCRVVRRQKSIFECSVLIFVAFLRSQKRERRVKWIIFFTLNKINLKMLFSPSHPATARHCPLYTQCTLFFYYYFDYFLRVSVLRCLFKLNMFNGFRTVLRRCDSIMTPHMWRIDGERRYRLG